MAVIPEAVKVSVTNLLVRGYQTGGCLDVKHTLLINTLIETGHELALTRQMYMWSNRCILQLAELVFCSTSVQPSYIICLNDWKAGSQGSSQTGCTAVGTQLSMPTMQTQQKSLWYMANCPDVKGGRRDSPELDSITGVGFPIDRTCLTSVVTH